MSIALHVPDPTVRSPRRRFARAPRLLTLVYLASLGIVLAFGAAFVLIVDQHVSDAALASSVHADESLLREFVATNVTDADLSLTTQDPTQVAQVESELRGLVAPGQILRVKLWAPDGTILLSDVAGLRGQKFELEDDLQDAFTGQPSSEISTGDQGEERQTLALPAAQVVGEYLPLVRDAKIPAVFEVYRDAAPIIAGVDDTRRDVIILSLIAALALAVVLRLIFKAASDRIERQTTALMESARRDALTGMLNHGAIVEVLAEELERAHRDGGSIGLGLVDIDNFRLLNDVHGHAAGDRAMREVAQLLHAELSHASTLGRFGPDEFLIVAPAECVHDLEPAIARLRTRLIDISLQFGASERLPVTCSAGVAFSPINGEATTELLSSVTIALGEAKGGGGDAIRVADGEPIERQAADARSFDVLKGLVLAVDTKDRYTLRHSEDVARYAGFLAQQLGLGAEQRRALRIAALLHDVGKIGIPDAILRKPDGLTTDEYTIVKQHVALGHLIVRDMANLGQVRAGIRYHHERWDGRGYLAGLAGEDIPVVARILAVADAFSAMTTSRPYRKALDIGEALRRLEDAADTQLDPRLAVLFMRGMETEADAPLPGDPVSRQAIWKLLEDVA